MKWTFFLSAALILTALSVVIFRAGTDRVGKYRTAPVRRVFTSHAELGTVSDMFFTQRGRASGTGLVIATQQRAVFFDKDLQPSRSVDFAWAGELTDIVPPEENSGAFRFFNRGSWSTKPSLINHRGEHLWLYDESKNGINDACAADVDNDTRMEFVLAYNGRAGIHLADHHGDTIWKQPAVNVWHVETTPADDGTRMIVHSTGSGELVVRSADGTVKRRLKPKHRPSFFSLAPWPRNNSSDHAVIAGDDGIHILKLTDGTTVVDLAGSAYGTRGRIAATAFTTADGRHLFAVIVSLPKNKKSIFTVYNETGDVLYEDGITSICPSVAPAGNHVLVGCENVVYSYDMRNI